jgi:hypothetical protein
MRPPNLPSPFALTGPVRRVFDSGRKRNCCTFYDPATDAFVTGADNKPVVTEKKGPTRADEVRLLLALSGHVTHVQGCPLLG